MTNNQIELNADIIYNKDFKSSVGGYNKVEVDEFLDIILHDYKRFEDEIAKLKTENQRFKSNQVEPQQRSAHNQSNYDVIKRLSNLEKEVFGHKINDQDL